MIQDIYNSYYNCANTLPGWQDMSKTELANGYCDADDNKDETKRNQYYSALMCRYWFKVFKLYNESRSTRLDIEDFSSWLSESLDIAFRYRSWRDPNDKLYNDPDGPDKVINRCIYSTRKRWYTYFNKDKRKINYQTNSLDSQIEEFGDSAIDLLAGSEVGFDESDYNCKEIIKLFIEENNIKDALLIDAICYQDSFKDNGFNERKVVEHLKSLNPTFINYFSHQYKVNRAELNKVTDAFNSSTSTQLHRYVRKFLKNLKNNKKVMDILCL